MKGNNTLLLCDAAAMQALQCYLNEHVMTPAHQVVVTRVSRNDDVWEVEVEPEKKEEK